MKLWYFVYDGKDYFFGVTQDGVTTRAHTTLAAASTELNHFNEHIEGVSDANSVAARNAYVMHDLELDAKSGQHRTKSYIASGYLIHAHSTEEDSYYSFEPTSLTLSKRYSTKEGAIRAWDALGHHM